MPQMLSVVVKPVLVASTFWLACTASFLRADEAATRAILNVVPADMAGCIIVEDLAGYCDRIGRSPFWTRFNALPVVKTVLEKPEIHGLIAMRGLLPAFAGVQFEELRDRVVGSSVVLAFRPGKAPADGDTGIVFCHVADANIRKRFWEAMTRPGMGRSVETRKYKSVEYMQRTEGAKKEFLVRLDAVLALSDKESAVQASIDAQAGGRAFGGTTALNESKQNLPAGCLIRVLLDPRAFDGAIETAARRGTTPIEKESGATLLQTWKSLRWAAITLRIDDRLEFGCHASLDLGNLPSDVRSWLDRTQKPAEIWKLAPANALMAATCEIDFVDLGKTIEAMLKSSTEADARTIGDLLAQIILGYDVPSQVFPRMGPETCVIVSPAVAKPRPISNVAGPGAKLAQVAPPPDWADFIPNVVACVRLNAGEAEKPGSMPLHEAIETSLRPFMVFAGVDHNRKTGDSVRIDMSVFGQQRVHSAVGSKQLPAWLQPAFSCTRDWLLLGTSSTAIKDILAVASAPLAESTEFKELIGRLPKGFTMSMYLSVRQMRASLAAVDPRIFEGLGGSAAGDKPKALDPIQSAFGLFEAVVAGASSDNSVYHWTAMLLPEKDASFRPQ